MTPSDPLLAGVAGTRVLWDQVPSVVRRSIEARLGAPVVEAVSQESGFSPALAARLRVTDGRRFFVKAIGPDEDSGAPGGQASYRREAAITAQLPSLSAVPHLHTSWEAHGWTVLLLEDIAGHNPQLPWRTTDLRRVLDAVRRLAGALTPSPVEVPRAAVPGAGPHWAQLAGDSALLERTLEPDDWLTSSLEKLARLEEDFDAAAAGNTLVHYDIRADNVLLAADRVVFVDWPHAKLGAPWLDLLFLLPSVAMQGGPDADQVFWSHPLARDADREAVVVALAGLAGFLLHGSTQAAPPGLPTLPDFQRAQAKQALTWLRKEMLR